MAKKKKKGLALPEPTGENTVRSVSNTGEMATSTQTTGATGAQTNTVTIQQGGSVPPGSWDEFRENDLNSPNRGKPGYVQAEDGSWVPESFYQGPPPDGVNPDRRSDTWYARQPAEVQAQYERPPSGIGWVPKAQNQVAASQTPRLQVPENNLINPDQIRQMWFRILGRVMERRQEQELRRSQIRRGISLR